MVEIDCIGSSGGVNLSKKEMNEEHIKNMQTTMAVNALRRTSYKINMK